MYTGNCIESSNLSFTATFCKHKPLIFLEKVGGLWFLASEKSSYGNRYGNKFDIRLMYDRVVSIWWLCRTGVQKERISVDVLSTGVGIGSRPGLTLE